MMEPQKAKSNESIEVLIVRHSLFNQVPMILLLLLVTALSIYGTYQYRFAFQEIFTIAGISVKLPLFGIFPLFVGAILAHRVMNEKLVFHPEYLLFREGVLSWREISSRIEYEWIREVNIKQNIFQKILDVGELRVSTVATQIAAEVTMFGVRDPRKVKDEIYRRIEAARKTTTPHEDL